MTRVRMTMRELKGDGELSAMIRGPNAMLVADGLQADFEKIGYVLIGRFEA